MGVDTEAAMAALAKIPISLHCWQGDDVGGFENTGEGLSGGIAVTGNYPGKARTPDELRADLDKALSLIPGKHRLNLHAFYGEFGGRKVDRDEIEPGALQGLDRLGEIERHRAGFQPDLLRPSEGRRRFHPLPSEEGDPRFLDRALHRCREKSARDGQGARLATVTNVWIPDGYKDTPVDRFRRASASPTRSTRCSRRNSTRRCTSTRSSASCSASAARVMSSARTSSTWATRSKTRSCSASTPAISTPPKASPTSSARC
jgi:L-rhamnose isomerase